jgi:predicted RNA binding protein YcfA (HicA-like mRNA interferase family)
LKYDKIKPLSHKKIIKALEKVGFQPVRQTGSHLFMKNPDGRTTIIPIHSKEIKVEIINAILNEAKISRDEWIELIRSLIIF